MKFYWFLLGLLGVWRFTHLLSAEDGPWQIVVWLRRKVGDGFWGGLLDCFNCLSLWVAAPFAVVIEESLKARLFIWLALSGGAILLQRLTSDRVPPVPGYFEHGDQHDVMLRESEKPTPADHTPTND